MTILGPGDVVRPDAVHPGSIRLQVLEMTAAAVAARLSEDEFFEVVALLAFIARGADAMRDGGLVPAGAEVLEAAGNDAAEMLARIARSRRRGRPQDDEAGQVQRATPA